MSEDKKYNDHTSPQSPLSEIDQLKAKTSELTDTLKRVQADYINFKQRTERDRSQYVKTANRDLISEIISIVDIFEMALGTIKEHTETTKGFEMVYHQLLDLLKRHHVEIIDAVNVKVDPTLLEVVSVSNEKGKKDFVKEVQQKGYKLQDYTLRAAKVIVFG